MSLANFATARMAATWGTMAANTGQACHDCHGNGESGMIITPTEALYFKTITEQKSYLLKYFSVDSVAGKVIINMTSFTHANTVAGHPGFNPTTNAGMTALKTFYDATIARKLANTCDPSRLLP